MSLKDNDPNGSKYPGFKSGVSKDGSPLFVGTGKYSDCGGDLPAMMSTSPDNKGAYSVWDKNLKFDDKEAKYFIDHPKLKWVATNSTSYDRVAGALLAWRTGNAQSNFARVTLSNERGKTFYQIGVIENNEICYWQNAANCGTDTFDILTCTR